MFTINCLMKFNLYLKPFKNNTHTSQITYGLF